MLPAWETRYKPRSVGGSSEPVRNSRAGVSNFVAAMTYIHSMHSVADDLRAEIRRDLSGRTPAERVAVALVLGGRDVGLFAEAHDPPLDRRVAARLLERRRQAGRRRSRCIEELIG
jgi:hypothetical protein